MNFDSRADAGPWGKDKVSNKRVGKTGILVQQSKLGLSLYHLIQTVCLKIFYLFI